MHMHQGQEASNIMDDSCPLIGVAVYTDTLTICTACCHCGQEGMAMRRTTRHATQHVNPAAAAAATPANPPCLCRGAFSQVLRT